MQALEKVSTLTSQHQDRPIIHTKSYIIPPIFASSVPSELLNASSQHLLCDLIVALKLPCSLCQQKLAELSAMLESWHFNSFPSMIQQEAVLLACRADGG